VNGSSETVDLRIAQVGFKRIDSGTPVNLETPMVLVFDDHDEGQIRIAKPVEAVAPGRTLYAAVTMPNVNAPGALIVSYGNERRLLFVRSPSNGLVLKDLEFKDPACAKRLLGRLYRVSLEEPYHAQQEVTLCNNIPFSPVLEVDVSLCMPLADPANPLMDTSEIGGIVLEGAGLHRISQGVPQSFLIRHDAAWGPRSRGFVAVSTSTETLLLLINYYLAP
jgi:hypothetical protein